VIQGRHWFVLRPLALPPAAHPMAAKASQLELAGNWHGAGEEYVNIRNGFELVLSAVENAKLSARAGSCFQIAGDTRISARHYEQAAQNIATSTKDPQLSAELFNRAAIQYGESSEFFFAGSAWVRAAEEFGKVSASVINCSENLSPLPNSAFKSHLCGSCFEAAAEAYSKADGNEMWSVMTYWRAGKAYASGIPNIQTFNAYRRSLIAAIRNYGTLELDSLRRFLPLSEEERKAKVDPILIMENALSRSNNNQQQVSGNSATSSMLATHRQMAAAFHRFSIEFQSVGNASEAGLFRAAKNERNRQVYILQKNYIAASVFCIWRLTSNYGESLVRWATTCAVAILCFAVVYGGLHIVKSTTPDLITSNLHFLDYIYFSVITFSTLGYGDLHPVGAVGEIVSSIEVFTGFIMFGILLSFVGNRFQRG
jgi:hypothetical protein